MFKTTSTLLAIIFILSLSIRFLYFPENVNFAYDQARDSFASLDILKGDLKIIGPPTTVSKNLFHGVLFYYLLAPIYFFTNGNVEVAAAGLRVINALGVFLVFYIGSSIFSRQIGYLSAFLYAVSYEQSQYSLFYGHPSLGVISVLLFYLGLSVLIFKNNPKGLIITLLGLGLTIQAEAVNGFLILVFAAFAFLFRKVFFGVSLKFKILAISVFLISVSNYILSEVKYNFRTISAILDLLTNQGSNSFSGSIWPLAIKRFIYDNFFGSDILVNISLFGLIIILFILLKDKGMRSKIIFLTIWFLGGLIPYLFATSFSYYYSPGASISLLILVAFLMSWIQNLVQDDRRNWLVYKSLPVVLIAAILYSNFSLIFRQNQKGPNPDIVIQRGMILGNQKKVLDYIYEKSNKENFSINAITVPLDVKTTWDFLFNWYGKGEYGYLPVWGREVASGFPGNLKIESKRSNLPQKRFTIIEPTTGIGQSHIDDFFKEENYFSKILEEKDFGGVKVQYREPY